MEDSGERRRRARKRRAEQDRKTLLRVVAICAYCVFLLVAGLHLQAKGKDSGVAGPSPEDIMDILEGGEPQGEPQVSEIPEVVSEVELAQEPSLLAEDPDPDEGEVLVQPVASSVVEVPRYPAGGRVTSGPRWVFCDYYQEWRYLSGVEIETDPGETVEAVLSGTVISVLEDPVLGKVVTIGHGGGLVAEYGRLGECMLGIGDAVLEGDRIAQAAEVSVYFSLMRGGESVLPDDGVLR